MISSFAESRVLKYVAGFINFPAGLEKVAKNSRTRVSRSGRSFDNLMLWIT